MLWDVFAKLQRTHLHHPKAPGQAGLTGMRESATKSLATGRLKVLQLLHPKLAKFDCLSLCGQGNEASHTRVYVWHVWLMSARPPSQQRSQQQWMGAVVWHPPAGKCSGKWTPLGACELSIYFAFLMSNINNRKTNHRHHTNAGWPNTEYLQLNRKIAWEPPNKAILHSWPSPSQNIIIKVYMNEC